MNILEAIIKEPMRPASVSNNQLANMVRLFMRPRSSNAEAQTFKAIFPLPRYEDIS